MEIWSFVGATADRETVRQQGVIKRLGSVMVVINCYLGDDAVHGHAHDEPF